ncbi:kinase-like domain-containing protein [Rhizophagus clarus]|uniref:Kinase-like domain-containing protein n=1 Tax=Rhizophagus clarus TaxID=94130 RepID=A0A8H3M4M4_9GLOM|nr:kinase-like domain-containing protein [Rhizophagus clarus]
MASILNSENACTDGWTQWIEDGIAKGYINYHDYNEFQNITCVGAGGFGKVYRATWESSDIVVALKSLKNNSFMKEIVNEIKLLHKVNFHKNIIQFFGITKKNWNIKLRFAIQIADAVSCMHRKDIIHRDLHSNNILVHQNMIKLADFGLSRRLVEVSSTQRNIFGLLPYIDPQYFEEQTNNNDKNYHYKANKKSDVYSVGVLLWEISSGQKPFESYDAPYKQPRLILEILNGKRETPVSNTPIDYINIYTRYKIDIYEETISIIENNTLINNDNDIDNNNSLSPSINHSLQAKYNKLIEEYDEIDLNDNESIINELLSLYEDAYVKKGIYIDDYIQLVRQHIKLKNKNENELFNYLLNNKNKQKYSILLADFYLFEIGTEKDKIKAFKLYQEAVKNGDITSVSHLAYCYLHGKGTEKNEIKVLELYKAAAEKDEINSINDLGCCYLHGIGTEKNEIKALELFKEASEKGNGGSISNLGYCYLHGIGTEKNEIQTFKLYKEAAEKGNISSINALGYCYLKGIGTGEDEIKAFKLFKEAAEKDHIDAIYNLGCCYKYGKGTNENEIKAFELFKKAAERGHLGSLDSLIKCYQYGIGTEKDVIKADELYKKHENELIKEAIYWFFF